MIENNVALFLLAEQSTTSAPLTFVEIAMFIFIAVFIGLIIWLLLARRGTFNRVARIPLEDDRVVTPRRNRPQASDDTTRPPDTSEEERNAQA